MKKSKVKKLIQHEIALFIDENYQRLFDITSSNKIETYVSNMHLQTYNADNIDCVSVTVSEKTNFKDLINPNAKKENKWYNGFDGLNFFSNVHANGYSYGFDNKGNWIEKHDIAYYKRNYPGYVATDEEVKAALIKEAKKRGITEGALIQLLLPFKIPTIDSIKFENNTLFYKYGHYAFCVFDNGQWVEVIEAVKKMSKEIDWSIPGQLVEYMGKVIITYGCDVNNKDESCFSGTIVKNDVDTAPFGHFSREWSKRLFKPYTGEPIILK